MKAFFVSSGEVLAGASVSTGGTWVNMSRLIVWKRATFMIASQKG